MASWTTPKTWAVGDILTATDMNTYVRDNSQIWIPASAVVATSQTTTSTSYTDLGTSGPAVTVTTGTTVIVGVGAHMANNTSGDGAMMSVDVSGTTTAAASDTNAAELVAAAVNQAIGVTAWTALTGLSAGSNTFTAKYKAVTGGTATFSRRNIIVVNVPA